ncbi:MAG: NADH-quinone oxidoreductase subunit D [Anaerolineaceae bacterium]|nr:NADH-quinone oxidoreductase subunit D [Anaerolineaceae bacterium]
MLVKTSSDGIKDLLSRYGDSLLADTRPGFGGYFIKTEQLVPFCRSLRDEAGYDYLSSVTGVDNFPEDQMEVVYHFYKTIGGPAFVLKVQASRHETVIPSLTPLYPGVEFQECEAWDLLGIRFEGHPDLRRILMWEGFEGFPLRKDWREPFFEDENKPFKSRWPDGHVLRTEEENPYKNNVQYPAAFDPDQWIPAGDAALYEGLLSLTKEGQSDFKTDHIVVNLGPQHPSTHGVFRMVVALEGETVLSLKPVMGYLHRNHEKIGERNTFVQNMPFTDRLDYISSMSNNFGYALAVEKLMDVHPPERAEYIRVIMAELTRFLSHIFSIGFLLNDLGAFFTPALYAIEERELILDIFEAASGSRMMCNYFRFGGVVRDLPDGVLGKIKDLVIDRLPRKLDEFERYLTKNDIVRVRCEGVGVLKIEEAIGLSAAGPVLRASGVPYDVRKADPYSIYDRFDFDVAYGLHGDIYDRYLVRVEEMRQSLRILKQALRDIPGGAVMNGKPQYQVRVPAGEAYGRVEGPKGELGFYVISNGKPNPWRYHVRAPSFINLTSLSTMAKNQKIADVVALLGSIDIVLGEVDR